MAFNKAKEEYKWKQWKEAEESKMRELGVKGYHSYLEENGYKVKAVNIAQKGKEL